MIDPNGIYSKHYYAGTQRIVSRLGEEKADIFNTGENRTTNEANDSKKLDDTALRNIQVTDLKEYLKEAKIGKVSFKEYKGSTYQEEEAILAEDVKENSEEGDLEQERAPVSAPVYFYHPDHLGSSTFLTDANGNPYQFFINLPFGETMAEQLPDTYYRTPFKFNGKELDEETGLYYYGARYYDPKISIWLSVDPLAEKYPNESPYIYCGNNPIVFIDPDGMDRIYSASGYFLEDTGKGNLIKVQIGNRRVNLSALNYNSEGTKKVVSMIIAREAFERGYRGKYGLYKGDRGGAHSDPSTKDVRFNINELKKGSYDDYHTLRNVIGHEADPVWGHKSENILSENYTYLHHAKVYLGQALDKDFEYSSIGNQATTAEGFIERLYGSAVKESGVNFDEYIEKFNNNKGKVKIISINGNSGTMEYSIDGKSQESKDIIIPKTPQG